jgi:hypothetical protein
MEGGTMTYEDKHALGITFPTFYHFFVLFFSQIEIHSEQGFRTIRFVVSFLQDLSSIWGEEILI